MHHLKISFLRVGGSGESHTHLQVSISVSLAAPRHGPLVCRCLRRNTHILRLHGSVLGSHSGLFDGRQIGSGNGQHGPSTSKKYTGVRGKNQDKNNSISSETSALLSRPVLPRRLGPSQTSPGWNRNQCAAVALVLLLQPFAS